MPDERVLQHQEKQTQPKRQVFAGRVSLVEGLFEGSRHKHEDGIVASRFVYETVKQLVDAKAILRRYETALIEEASRICQTRADSAKAALVQANGEDVRPASEEEALVAGIRRIGLEATVKGKRVAPSGNFVFNVEVAGSTCYVMIPKDIMQGDDPAAVAEGMARKQGIQTREEEKIATLERRRNSRPPPENIDALCVDKAELDGRELSVDGISGGKTHFTYLLEKIGASFSLPADISGKQLLAELDRKIFLIHMQFEMPFEAKVLEASMPNTTATDGVEGIAQGSVKAVAKSLHMLLTATEVDERLVPLEYLESYRRLRDTADFQEFNLMSKRGVISREEADAFEDSFRKVAHPTDSTILSWFHLNVGEGNEMSAFDRSMLTTILATREMNPLGLCERALRNLYEAYALMYGDGQSPSLAELEKNHLFYTIMIRKGIDEKIPAELRRLAE